MKSAEWKHDVSRLLAHLHDIDFGYPIGDNILYEPLSFNEMRSCLARANMNAHDLETFYSVCDELSWPDIHNGYFLKRSCDISMSNSRSEITELFGHFNGPIVILGSSGGGDLIAIRRVEGDILWLPPGTVKGTAYHYDDDRVTHVGNTLTHFLTRLADDLRAFVYDDGTHHYLP